MKPVTVIAFEATDGTVFWEKEGAEKHEAYLALKDELTVFINSELCPYSAPTQTAMVCKIVYAWEAFRKDKAAQPVHQLTP